MSLQPRPCLHHPLSAVTAAAVDCPNGGADLCRWAQAASPSPFCPACGQETRVLPPTVREFGQQLGGAYVSTEGALWRTSKLLLTQPGELTVQYPEGRRKHYVLPLRLYLTIGVALLLLTRVLGGIEVASGLYKPELRAKERGEFDTLVFNSESFILGIRSGDFVCTGLPAALCALVRQRAAPDARTLPQRLRLAK